MRRQKLNVFLIIVLLIVSSSCRSLRLAGGRGENKTGEINAGRFMEEMKSTNITDRPIAINRIIINYENSYERRRLRANAKMDGKGNLLVSIRTFAGIEAARIIIGKDTVKVADRINRICYVGDTKIMEEKYGIEYKFIHLLFGDFVETDVLKRRLTCRDGLTEIDDYKKGIKYTVDCDLYKIIEAVGNLDKGERKIRGTFSEFTEENGMLYPASIKWELGVNNLTIDMDMQNIRKSDNDELIFRVSDSYQVKRLR